MSHRCSVVLADDHAVVRAGITRTVAETRPRLVRPLCA